MFYLSDGMTFEVLQSLFLQAHFYIHRSFSPQLDSSSIHTLIVLNADALSFASQLFIGTETNITINKESLMHFLFYENLFMDFEIQSVSDLFSILFKMEGQTDLEKDRCGNISLPASVSFYPMLFSTHEFPMAAHPDHGKMSFSFRYNHPGVPTLFQFLSHSILLLFHLHSQL